EAVERRQRARRDHVQVGQLACRQRHGLEHVHTVGSLPGAVDELTAVRRDQVRLGRDAHAATAAAMRFRSSRKATIRRALSSGESLSESTWMSGSSGFSYGSFTPVKFWSSPFVAFS